MMEKTHLLPHPSASPTPQQKQKTNPNKEKTSSQNLAPKFSRLAWGFHWTTFVSENPQFTKPFSSTSATVYTSEAD